MNETKKPTVQHQQEPKKKKSKKLLIIGLLLAALGLAMFCWCIYDDFFADKTPPAGITAEVDATGETKTEYTAVEYIKFPGYNDMTYTDPSQTLNLYNPKENGVYFIFTVEEPGTGEMIWESEKIYPGEKYSWDIQSYFSEGEHLVNLVIKTFHVESGAAMNGLNEVLHFTIE